MGRLRISSKHTAGRWTKSGRCEHRRLVRAGPRDPETAFRQAFGVGTLVTEPVRSRRALSRSSRIRAVLLNGTQCYGPGPWHPYDVRRHGGPNRGRSAAITRRQNDSFWQIGRGTHPGCWTRVLAVLCGEQHVRTGHTFVVYHGRGSGRGGMTVRYVGVESFTDFEARRTFGATSKPNRATCGPRPAHMGE